MLTGILVSVYVFLGMVAAVIAVKWAGPPPEPWFNLLVIAGWPYFLIFMSLEKAVSLLNKAGNLINKLAGRGSNEN